LGLFGESTFDGERMVFDDAVIQYRQAKPHLADFHFNCLSYFRGRRLRSIGYSDLVRFAEERRQAPHAAYEAHLAKRARLKAAGRIIAEKNIPKVRKPASVNRELELLRTILLFAHRQGWIIKNPFTSGPPLIVKSQEEIRDRIPTAVEEARILAACDDDPRRAHLRPYVIATRDTGLRRSALQELTWKCIDWNEDLIFPPPNSNRYKARPKAIGMTARLREELWQMWRNSNGDLDGPVMPEIKCFKRSWTTACRIAGIEGLRFNDLRHGFATDLMVAGIAEHYAMRLAGHSNPEIHKIYTNVDRTMARQAAEALNQLHQNRSGK
jgi:integrase